MTDRVVAFDGVPIEGGCGARAAIFELAGEAQLRASDGRTVSAQRLDELAVGGFVTRVSLAARTPSLDGLVVYRARTEVPEITAITGVTWTTLGSFEVTYLSRAVAKQVLESLARDKHLRAIAALRGRRHAEASTLARQGLMAVPSMRESPIAANLYAILYAVNYADADALARIEREIAVMLCPASATIARREGARFFASTGSTAAPGDRDVLNRPGAVTPPRRVA
jgi:hypothetical protein